MDLAIISADDHIIEPPHLWQSRLPAKYRDVGPRIVVREVGAAEMRAVPSKQKDNVVASDGGTEFWAFEDLLIPTGGLAAAISMDRDKYSLDPINYSQMRPGCYDPVARLEDMDLDGTLASLCFPSFGRLCLQTFNEAKDKDLALLCVKAYNDFILDEWCAAAPGRYIPLCALPLWDVALCVQEIERVAGLGAKAITFSENPAKLGMPSIHDKDHHWDPVFSAAEDAGLPVCMHIGSSSEPIITAPDAPMSIFVGLVPLLSQICLMDWLLSGVLVRHPRLKLVLSEGGIGWIPYILERTDFTWEHQGAWTNSPLTERPSTYFTKHFYGCFIDDAHGAKSIHEIGVENCMMEVDYPHSDSSWPHTQEIAAQHLTTLTDDELHLVSRGNAERVFDFQPSAIGSR